MTSPLHVSDMQPAAPEPKNSGALPLPIVPGGGTFFPTPARFPCKACPLQWVRFLYSEYVRAGPSISKCGLEKCMAPSPPCSSLTPLWPQTAGLTLLTTHHQGKQAHTRRGVQGHGGQTRLEDNNLPLCKAGCGRPVFSHTFSC